MTIRVPPHDISAEGAVLGACMLDERALSLIADLISEEDFYMQDHRTIYRAVCDLQNRGKPTDSVTMCEWFEQNGAAQLGAVSMDITSRTPSAANVLAYAEIVKQKSRCRQLIDLGTNIASAAYEPRGADPSVIASDACNKLGSFLSGPRSGGLEPARAAVRSWFQQLHVRYEMGDRLSGLATPFSGLNLLTQGLQPGDMIVIAGRPSMGKSVLWENLGRHCAMNGEAAAMFSLEMRKESLIQRGVSALTGIPHKWLQRPWELQETHWNDVTHAMQTISKAPYHIDDQRGLTAQQIVARAKRVHRERGPLKFVGVDHLGWLLLPGVRNKSEEIGYALKVLGNAAKENGWVLVLVSQLNRSLEARPNKRPVMSDLRESGEIEQDADVVLFTYRDEYYNHASYLKGFVELIPAKGRDLDLGDLIKPTDTDMRPCIALRNHYSTMSLTDWDGDLPQPPKPPSRSKSGGMKASPGLFGDKE